MVERIPLPSSRRRRPPNKTKPRLPWLQQFISMTSVIAVVVFICSLVSFPDDLVESPVRADDDANLKRDQCRESCRATLSTNGYSISGPKSSRSLSFSAVSAMFNIHVREGDESYLNASIHAKQQEPSGTGSGSGEQHSHSSTERKLPTQNQPSSSINDINTRTDLHANLKTRPRRLPPLIEELVGTLDSDHAGASASTGNSNILRRVKKHSKERLGEMTKQGLKDISNGDDSVAMVAAAAAAAVLSDSQAKRGILRMKIVNSDWEEALRWISSWGQNPPSTNKGDTQQQQQQNDSSSSSRSTRGANGKQQRRKRDSNAGQRSNRHSGRFNADNEIDFERFLDVCIDRCIGGEGEDRANSEREGGTMDMIATTLNLRTKLGVNQIFASFLSILHNLKSTKGLMHTRNRDQLLRGACAIFLSTATLWFIRNLHDWRKTTHYTNTLRSLLEEETKEANIHLTDATSKCRHSHGKKSKKARRRRRNHMKDRKPVTKTPSLENESEASEASEDSFERNFLEDKMQRINLEDQASKECNTTVSTCTTDGAEFEYQMMSTDATISKLKAANQNFKTNKHQIPPNKRNLVGLKASNNKQNHDSRRQEQNLPNSNKHSPKVHAKAYDTKHKQGNTMGEYNTPMVPTPEQREEAARKLREFQQAQIQKIINSKKRQYANTNKSILYSAAKQITLRDLAQVNTPQTVGTTNFNNNLEMMRPPPGLSEVKQAESDALEIHEPDHETDPGYLLSLLDDEDEEPKCKSAPKETTPDRYYNNPNEQPRSIALGDLLVGSYSASNNSNLNFSSNPWAKDESVSGSTSTADTCISSPSRPSMTHNSTSLSGLTHEINCSNDANMCLQVSAVAFSPSMGTSDQKIW